MYTVTQRLRAFEQGYKRGRRAEYQREPIPFRIAAPSTAAELAEAEGFAVGFSDAVLRSNGERLA
jgi:hypothetical protein